LRLLRLRNQSDCWDAIGRSGIQNAAHLECQIGIGERLKDDLGPWVEPALMNDRIAYPVRLDSQMQLWHIIDKIAASQSAKRCGGLLGLKPKRAAT
jgi:hypothetical protein